MNSNKTAIKRNSPSLPMRNLNKLNLLKGKTLDFGSGKGFDAEFFNMDKYDPYFSPVKLKGKYNTITCNYVLNTLEKEQESIVINEIKRLLAKKGTAYITVRRDIKKEGVTKRGTFQRNVILDLPILKETSTYCIYILKNFS